MAACFKTLSVLALMSLGLGNAEATPIATEVIDNLNPTVDLGGLAGIGGSGPGYFGQTFRAPGGVLQEAQILIGANGPGDTRLRVLVVEVSPILQPDPNRKPTIFPTKVLFESAELMAPVSTTVNELSLFTIDLGNVELTHNSTYAILLDTFESADGIDDSALVGANQFMYDDGLFFYYAVGAQSAPSTRALRFADTSHWLADDVGFDLRFKLSFVGVPEPSSLSLLGLGLAGLVFGARRTLRKACT